MGGTNWSTGKSGRPLTQLEAASKLGATRQQKNSAALLQSASNAAKHAHASVVTVELDTHVAIVRLVIRDDGVGGADPGQGSGLLGLRDRIEALGGTLEITSPAGKGTTLLIGIPLHNQSSAAAPEP